MLLMWQNELGQCSKVDERFFSNHIWTQRSSVAVRAVATEAAAKMIKAIRIHEHGGPEVLKWEDVEVGEPKDGEIRVKNEAIGINFIAHMRCNCQMKSNSYFKLIKNMMQSGSSVNLLQT